MRGKIYNRSCDQCGKDYEGWGEFYCSRACRSLADIGKFRVKPGVRFWRKVLIGGLLECWEWKAARTTRSGYGIMQFKGRPQPSHRIAWMLTYGAIPKGLYVLHKCDNPPCVNPNHLFLGTQKDNMADCVSKGRSAKGSKSGKSKLVEADVIAIRKMGNSGVARKVIAEQFHISATHVHALLSRKEWRHL